MIDAIFYVLDFLVQLLPTFNMMKYIDEIPYDLKTILGYVNYFVPVAEMVSIIDAWFGCILLYFTYLNVEDIVKAAIKKYLNWG